MGWSIGTFSLDGTWVGWGDTEKRGLAWSVGVGWRAPGSYFIQRCHGGAPRGRLVGATGRGRLGQEGAEPPARWGPGGGLGMAQNSPTQGGAPLRAHTHAHTRGPLITALGHTVGMSGWRGRGHAASSMPAAWAALVGSSLVNGSHHFLPSFLILFLPFPQAGHGQEGEEMIELGVKTGQEAEGVRAHTHTHTPCVFTQHLLSEYRTRQAARSLPLVTTCLQLPLHGQTGIKTAVCVLGSAGLGWDGGQGGDASP